MATNKYEARWRNAVAIANRINELLNQGYIVLDANRDPVSPFVITETEIKTGSDNIFALYFEKDIDRDDGMHTSIKKYNAQFKNWVAIHPKDFQLIF
jgi:hypothetical protein